MLVKGVTSSIICDLQRNNYEHIPNDLYNILKKYDGKKNIDDIKYMYNNEFDKTLDDYFEFLHENEFIFFTRNPEYFPKMDLSFHYAFDISNAIIDYNQNSTFDIIKILDNLESLNCKFLEFRFYSYIKLELIEKILKYITENEMIISFISFLIQSSDEVLLPSVLEKIMIKYQRCSSFIIGNSKEEKYIPIDKSRSSFIYFTKRNIDSNIHCGTVNPNQFSINHKMFTESFQYNSCLNKKISIDVDGNIKNCPSMPQSFGNIADVTLEQAIDHVDFRKYWNLTKDHIEVCKDCEFRYICTDCRAYTEKNHQNNEGLDVSKPLKCGYDPYSGEWEDWSTNPLKQKAKQYYKMN